MSLAFEGSTNNPHELSLGFLSSCSEFRCQVLEISVVSAFGIVSGKN